MIVNRKKIGILIIVGTVFIYILLSVILYIAATVANSILPTDSNFDLLYGILEAIHRYQRLISFICYFIFIAGIGGGVFVILSSKKFRIVTVFISVVLLAMLILLYFIPPYPRVFSPRILPNPIGEVRIAENEIEFTGVVSEYVNMSSVDGEYYLVVSSSKGPMKIYFADTFGLAARRNSDCPYIVNDYLQNAGTPVAVFGKIIGEHEISLCGSNKYYIVPRIL